ncbi:Putative pleckstrin domain, PH-like domain superfamily [Septoria linicola]|uniref:Pleckstrin domain, PH-like domain superfamily n=1 Tax=Septoria linicola TaxID=215465 RepID=A0A9Q9EKJ9_9PEZI|nr:Putative pleckstrin domain, PH-like domain superfamily [Septoria linicola]
MSQWGGAPRSPTAADDVKEVPSRLQKSTPPPRDPSENDKPRKLNLDTETPQSIRGYRAEALGQNSPHSPSTQSRARAESRANTRPNSMIQTYNPMQMELASDTPPELAPIFSYLNSHSNKLYQEGYFLKLHDLDSSGRPSRDRTWTECFAQLVGTVLSLWDAAALDAAGEDGEVVPTFINLSDASIKMIESLPMNGMAGGSLQNVLSVSTAANNRYLLHFNSLNSLTQWTAGIRLAMFEHSTLQEAYTGSLIAGKGRNLNGIRQIMERSKFVYDDWARVRFGAGTPWRRCWCVVSPPDEKEWQKSQKTLKKGGAYSRAQLPKGDIKFYDTRKVTKKTKPIATISDAYAAYAIYPQSKPLVEQSTLVKLEGLVTIHGGQETTTEGFVFVMPEVHAAVSGFEIMLRWLFPVYDTFGLYGRPTRLIADTVDARGLMFAMPKDRRYGYLDILDVSGLIHEKGSQNWSERQWRKEMRKLTATRMAAQQENGDRDSRSMGFRRNTTNRNSLPPIRNGVQFQDQAATQSTPGSRSGSPPIAGPEFVQPPKRTDSAPPSAFNGSPHKRSVSEAQGHRKYMSETPSRLSYEQSGREDEQPPAPPRHGGILAAGAVQIQSPVEQPQSPIERVYSDDRMSMNSPYEQVAAAASPYLPPPEPVVSPPEMQHHPQSRPATQPHVAPELRRAHSNVDAATLSQMQEAVQSADIGGYAGAQGHEQTLAYRDQHLSPANQSQSYRGNGLESIPGSPHHAVGGDGEYFDAIDGSATRSEQRPDLTQNRSSQSINRKPLPGRQLPQVPPEGQSSASNARSGQYVSDMDSPASPASPANSDTLDPTFVNEDLLERVLNDSQSIASSDTPDYASSHRSSIDEQKRKQQQEEKTFERYGKLKTVGDPNLAPVQERAYGASKLDTWNKDKEVEASEIPVVEFGPTYTYKVNSRPSTSGTMTPGDMENRHRSRSRDRLRDGSTSRLSAYFDGLGNTPTDERRASYFGPRTPTPSGIEAREAEEPLSKRQSIIWTPGSAAMGSALAGLTPEQYVQRKFQESQRPQYAIQPQYAQRNKSLVPPIAHGRHASTNDLPQLRKSMAKTPPPFQRAASGDWTAQQASPQRTPPSRPHSRNFLRSSSGSGLLNGTAVNLSARERTHSRNLLRSSSGSGLLNGTAVNLSARERTQVSRMTGAPLVGMAVNTGKNVAYGAPNEGLLGALADREREKAAGNRYRNSAVQGAVAMTYQQQAQAQQAAIQAQQERQQQAQMAAQKAAQTAHLNQMAHERAQRMLGAQQQASGYGQSMYEAPLHRQSWSPGMMQQQMLQQQAQLQQMQQMQQSYVGGQSQPSVYGGQYVQQANMVAQQQPYGYAPGQQGQQGSAGAPQQYYQPRR